MADETTIEQPSADVVERTEHTRNVPHYRPNVDIVESAEELTVLADMPGVSAEDIDIHFEKGVLTLHGRVKPRQAPQTGYLVREYGIGDFYRTFQVSEAVDPNRITADYRNGVLTLHLAKIEAVKPRRISVQAG